MIASDRRRNILGLVQLNGGMSTADLAVQAGASLATIRRDLKVLEREGLIVRTRGGAVTGTHSTAYEPQYSVKIRLRQDEKARIGRIAAGLVAEGDTVIFDSGSTARAVARSVRGRVMTAVALDLPVALDLASSPSIDVLVIGGQVRHGLYAVVGPFAEEMLRQIHVNRFFLGADSVDLRQGIGNASPAEVPLKRQAVAAAQEVILVADSSKFGRVSLVHVCDLRHVHHVVTDEGLSAEWRAMLGDMGIRLSLA